MASRSKPTLKLRLAAEEPNSPGRQKAIVREIAQLAQQAIISFIPKVQYGRLRQSIRFIATRDRIIIYSYYYWAKFVNDGRKTVKGDPVLIYYKDPKKDPRISLDYPRKPGDIKKLSKEQYRKAQKNDDLIVIKKVGPSKALRFIEQGVKLTRDQVPPAFRQFLRGSVKKMIRRDTNKITVVIG